MEKYLTRKWLCCAVVGFVALVLWGRTVTYDFVWDDGLYITDNDGLRSLANIPKFFYTKDLQSGEKPSIAYRPIRNTAFTLLIAAGGKPEPQPWVFHLANILCNAIVASLLYLVVLELFQRLAGELSPSAQLAALFVALGFAVHPVISEVVCWAKSLEDLLAATFMLISALALLKWETGKRNYLIALACFGLAIFCKESTAPFALATVFLFRSCHQHTWRQSAILAAPFFGVTLLYMTAQHLVMGHISQCPPLSGSYVQTLVDMFPVAQQYFRLLWGIPPFCADYNFMVGAPSHTFFSAADLGGLFIILFFGGVATWLWCRRPDWRISAFGLVWIALFLLPVSNIIPMMQFMAERFLYLPLMGFMLALGGIFYRVENYSKLATRLPAVALLVIWSATSLARMGIWHDNLTLFISTEMDHPGIKRVEKNAVAAIVRLPQIVAGENATKLTPAEAAPILATLERARRIFPENDVLTAYVGLTDVKIGQFTRAIALLELATRQHPASAERWYDLAGVYHLTGQDDKARQACAESLRLDPQFAGSLRLNHQLSAPVPGAAN
jgi:hypothetical protein